MNAIAPVVYDTLSPPAPIAQVRKPVSKNLDLDTILTPMDIDRIMDRLDAIQASVQDIASTTSTLRERTHTTNGVVQRQEIRLDGLEERVRRAESTNVRLLTLVAGVGAAVGIAVPILFKLLGG